MVTMQKTQVLARYPEDNARASEFYFPGPLPDGTLPDPPRNPDMMQRPHISQFDSTLGPFFISQGRHDIAILGEAYVCMNTRERKALIPDCMILIGHSFDSLAGRNGVVIEEVGKPPDFVLEMASQSTGRIDYTTKREGYARYRIPEYWRFDETGGLYHDQPLGGDRLVDGVYEPIELRHEPDGVIWGHSEVLGLDLCWVEGQLRFRHEGEYLPTPQETWDAREEAEAKREEAETRRAEAEAKREEAETRQEEAETRRAEAETRREEAETKRAEAEERADAEREARLAAEAELRQAREQIRRLQSED